MTEASHSQSPFNARILVVDDEKRIRDGIHKTLSQEGFEVDRAENGTTGLEMIGAEHFDVVLLDLMMPGISGMDVLSRIRALHPDTVVIVITGYATLEHSIEAMKKGAYDFIPKPFNPDELTMVVNRAMDYIRNLQGLATERSRTRALVNQLADGVMATDHQKRVAIANPAFLKMMGYRGGSAIGRAALEVVPHERLREMIDEALRAGVDEAAGLTCELELAPNDAGEDTVVGVRCTPFRDRLGRNLGTVTVLHDITTLKKLDKHRSAFVSMVAHEIKNPMNSVLMQLKVVLDGLAGGLQDKQEEILLRVRDKIQALVSLSSELLDLARIESGLITLERQAVDIGELLTGQVTFQGPKAASKNIRLELVSLPLLPPVLGNKHYLEVVLSNLIINAIHYTAEGGQVSLSACEEEHHVRVDVQDNGFGIAREDLQRIFERFYRVKNEKTRHIVGTGLGLAIVKSIVAAHNGVITVESEPGRGTAFHVYLPHAEH